MISFAKYSDKDSLKALFNEGFPNETAFCDWYYDNAFTEENCVVFKDNKEIVSQFSILPLKLKDNSTIHKGAYLFALCTKNEFRGKGIAAKVIKYCNDFCFENDCNVVTLFVQSKELFDFYERFGFKKCFFVSENFSVANELPDGFSVRKMHLDDYDAVNNIYVKHAENFIYNQRHKEEFKNILGAYNDNVYVLENINKDVIAYSIGGYAFEDCYVSTEGMGENIQILMGYLAKKSGFDTAKWFSTPTDDNRKPLGCVLAKNQKNIDYNKIYLNLLYN